MRKSIFILIYVFLLLSGIVADVVYPPNTVVENASVSLFPTLDLSSYSYVRIGFYDDKKAMKAQNKLFWQFIIAVIAVWPGEMRISLLGATQAVTIPLSILWFVFIMNAINFFDNMDGLLSGTAGIS